jgi:hypothetical protein
VVRGSLAALLLVTGSLSFAAAVLVDCDGGRYPAWIDVLIGSTQFGAAALLIAAGASSHPRLPAYVAMTAALMTLGVGLVLISASSLGSCAT